MPESEYWALHKASCERGETTYTDSVTGYSVFTRIGLLERGKCCGAGCRHCPFGHENVRIERPTRRIKQAAWLNEVVPDPSRKIAVLFWSGGKDSFLAYRALERERRFSVVLVTTYDARTSIIAHQEFPIDHVVEQAQRLGAPLIGVPIYPGRDYLEHVLPAFDLLPDCKDLCFGDLHLEHIRSWREKVFAGNGQTARMRLHFPLWKADYRELLQDLNSSGAKCEISATTANIAGISIGDSFDMDLIARLPDYVDPFGENGEFHTRIILEPADGLRRSN